MAMTLSFHENLDYAEAATPFEVVSSAPSCAPPRDERIHLFAEKMRIPEFRNYIARPRLRELLEKSSEQIGATLVTGRAETGKTALAADFAQNYARVAWYQIDAAESDWSLFSRYFAAILGEDFDKTNDTGEEVLLFVEKLLFKVAARGGEKMLIVLDDVHNVFDAEWFAEFFMTLLYSLAPNMHLLLLSRAKPPQPLWRLRSKQVLGVVDEKLLAFNLDETREFLRRRQIPDALAARVHAQSFGRLSALRRYAALLDQSVRKKKSNMT
jgi:ATP/maltotriose-dependent transcriptional regulator MalT